MEKQLEIPEFVTPCLPGIQHEYYGNYHLQYSNVTSSLLILTNDSFFSAIKTGDLSLVKKFFPKFKNVINQIRTPSGLYPLHIASIKGHYEIVKYLVEEQNALVDIIDNEKETPLLKAAYNGHKNIVQYLKMKNANIDYKDREGWTSLHNACSRGFLDIVQFLINSEADINCQNVTGQTPLMIASSKGYIDIVQLLIMTNVNPLLKNNLGETAYDIAAQNNEYYICAILENYEKEYRKKNKLSEIVTHNTVTEMIFENQRSSVLSINNFSSENLQKTDKCGPWSNKYGTPCNKEDIKLPKSNNSNGWFWMTDWAIDYKSPKVNKNDGWQYAKSFEDKPEMWSSEPIKGLSSIGGCVRRRIWIRVRKRKYINISPNTNLNNYVDASASSSNNNTNNLNNFNTNNNNLIIMNDNNNNTSNTYNNKSFLNEASSSSSKFSVTDTMDIYKSNSAYPYSDGYKQVSNLHQFLMNERINENQQQNQYSNNNYTASEFIINKKDNIFDSFNMVNSSGDKDLPFITESNSSISKSSEFDNAKRSGSKGKELSVEEKLNDKRKRNNAASARFRAKKKLKEQMTDLTAKEMTQKAQTLEIKVKEMELEIKWLRSLVTKNMESKTLKDVYEENGYLFINENDSSQNSQPDVNGIKLVSISDSVKSYTKCCCNIDKSKGGTCGKNGTIGHCKCGGIGYCLMNVNMNKNKKIIKPKITSNQYSLLSKTTV